MQLGKAIRVARVRKGWKQAELAAELGVSTTYVSLLECDKRDPSWSFVNRLSDALGVPLPLLLLLAQDEADMNQGKGGIRGLIANELLAIVAGYRGDDGGKEATR